MKFRKFLESFQFNSDVFCKWKKETEAERIHVPCPQPAFPLMLWFMHPVRRSGLCPGGVPFLSLICILLFVSSQFTYFLNIRINENMHTNLCAPHQFPIKCERPFPSFFPTHAHAPLFTYWKGAGMRFCMMQVGIHLKDTCTCPKTLSWTLDWIQVCIHVWKQYWKDKPWVEAKGKVLETVEGSWFCQTLLFTKVPLSCPQWASSSALGPNLYGHPLLKHSLKQRRKAEISRVSLLGHTADM